MDQKLVNSTSDTNINLMNPPAYTPLPYLPYPGQQQQHVTPFFPPSEEFGQSSAPIPAAVPGYPYPQQLNQDKDMPYSNAVAPGQVYSAGAGESHGSGPSASIPPIGFYIPPANPQHPINSDDEEPKFTPFHDDISGYAFSEKSIRMAFIRKVFGILSLQMLVTSACIGLFLYHPGLQTWTKDKDNRWFLWVVLGVYIVTACTLICFENVRRTAPANYIFLGIFTFATSIVVGVVCTTYDVDAVLMAAGITVVVCVSLTIFAFQTKIDFTRFSGILFVMLIVLLLFGIMTIFLRTYIPVIRMVYSALGALLFSVYLVHDVQLLIGGSHRQAISPEEYVFAALTIYLDIINIFLYLLRLFGNKG